MAEPIQADYDRNEGEGANELAVLYIYEQEVAVPEEHLKGIPEGSKVWLTVGPDLTQETERKTNNEMGGIREHASDCAVHNEPAYPKGECDCGADKVGRE
jgi:hypothetical protein